MELKLNLKKKIFKNLSPLSSPLILAPPFFSPLLSFTPFSSPFSYLSCLLFPSPPFFLLPSPCFSPAFTLRLLTHALASPPAPCFSVRSTFISRSEASTPLRLPRHRRPSLPLSSAYFGRADAARDRSFCLPLRNYSII